MADIFVTTGADPVVNGENFQDSLDLATPGDRVILTAGATYDGTFTLADKGASEGSPVTITTSATLPDRRIGPSDIALLPKVRTLGGGSNGAAFQFSNGAAWWIIDGLEITDNGPDSTIVHALIDASNTAFNNNNIVVKRNYFHNKETGTDYYRSIRWGVAFEGSGLTFQWNYVHLIGYYQTAVGFGDFYPMDTMAFGCITGNTLTIEDNYIQAWYVGFFLGGGDTAAQNTATITSSSTTSGTFSNTTGLAAGIMLRFDLEGAGNADQVQTGANGVIVTRSSGVTPTSADVGRPMRITSGANTGIVLITAVSGNEITATGAYSNWLGVPEGAITFTVYETALIDSVDGTTVNYTAFGIDALTSGAGNAPAKASWNYGDQGLVYDVVVNRNTFNMDYDFSIDVLSTSSNHPKGWFEVKNALRMTVSANYFLGYPAVAAWTTSNQTSTAPWITIREVTVVNNWFAATDPDDEGAREAIIFSDNQYIHTNRPSRDVEISNNFFKTIKNLLTVSQVENLSVVHNTILNNSPSGQGYATIATTTDTAVASISGALVNFEFRDNIVSYFSGGMQCLIAPNTLATCYPSATFQNNVVADEESVGFASTVWGAGGILTPIPATFDDVGFVNAAADNYELDVTSDYKGAATDMTDPGVDWNALIAALGGNPPGAVASRSRMRLFRR